MSLKSFFNSITSVIRRDTILDDFHRNMEELREFVEPSYNLDKQPDFQGKTYKEINGLFKREVRTSDDIYKAIQGSIKRILENEELIVKTIKEDLSPNRIKDTADYYTINLIKYFETISEFLEFSRNLITVISWETAQETLVSFKNAKTPVTIRAARTAIMDYTRAKSFLIILKVLDQPFSKYLKDIEDLKGHQYQDTDWGSNSNTVISMANRKLDPYQLGFLPVILNPVYHLGLAYNAWQLNKYHRNVADRQQLQLIILSMREELNDADEARSKELLRQIESYDNIVNKLNARIEAIEGKD